MHILVSWDISATGDRWSQINDSMRTVLKPYSWARPLSTVYIVKIAGEKTREQIIGDLQKEAERHSNAVNCVVTPVMTGRYNGFLPKDMWETINERTD